MEVYVLLAVFAISTLIVAVSLWLAMILTSVKGSFLHILLASAISAFVGMIPAVGWLISLVTLLWLICIWTDANLFPDAVLMVVVAWGLRFLTVMWLIGFLTARGTQ